MTTRTPGLAIFWDFGLHLRLQHASQVAVLLVHDFDKTMNCKPMSCNPLNVKSNTIAILGFISKIEMAHGLTKLPFGTSSPLEMAHGLNKMPFGTSSTLEMAHGLYQLPFGTSSPLEMAHGLYKLGFNRIFKDPVLSAICEQ